MTYKILGPLIACAMLVPLGPLWAHHSLRAVYDVTRTVTLTGTLTDVDWRNPHVELALDVESGRGQLEAWVIKGASPGFFWESTIGKDQFLENIGKTVTVEAYPGRDGTQVGGLLKITFPDGASVDIQPCC